MTLTNRQSGANVHEIADGIYRINTPVKIEGAGGFSFNQYLIVDDKPLLFHTGLRKMFPLVREAVASILREHAMGTHVRRLARDRDNIHVHVCYSRPTDLDRQGRDYDTDGHVDAGLLRGLLPHLGFDFYLCGPIRFMEGLRDALLGWGVDVQRIRSEHFGTPSAPNGISVPDRSLTESAGERPVQVHFKRSNVVARWAPGTPSLLDFAETQRLVSDSACRVGICQICTQRLVQGQVAYAATPAVMPEPGFILPCCTRPISDVVINL
jgi:ferredoxin